MVYIIWMVGQYPIEPLSGSEHSSNAGLLLHHGENAGPIHAEGDGLRRAVISDSHGRRTIVAEITSSLRAAAIDCPAPGKTAHERRRAKVHCIPARRWSRGPHEFRDGHRCRRYRRLLGRRQQRPGPRIKERREESRHAGTINITCLGSRQLPLSGGLPLGHVGDGHVAAAPNPAAFVEPQPRLPGRKAQHDTAHDPQKAWQRAVGEDLSELEKYD